MRSSSTGCERGLVDLPLYIGLSINEEEDRTKTNRYKFQICRHIRFNIILALWSQHGSKIISMSMVKGVYVCHLDTLLKNWHPFVSAIYVKETDRTITNVPMVFISKWSTWGDLSLLYGQSQRGGCVCLDTLL